MYKNVYTSGEVRIKRGGDNLPKVKQKIVVVAECF